MRGDRLLRMAHTTISSSALVPVLLLLCFSFLASPQIATAGSKSGWHIQQRSNFLGQREVFLTDSGFMAINHVSGHILITRAPDWNVRVANLKSKLYFVTPFETWMGRKVAVGEKAVRNFSTQKPKRSQLSKVICQLNATKWKIDGADVPEKRFVNGQRDPNDVDKIIYWTSPDLPFPKPARNTILTFYQLQPISEFPLEVTYIRGKHGKNTIKHLITTDVKKQSIEDSIFEIPKICKKANFEAEVWVDDKTREIFEMFK
jgi:hypothetical protein